LTRKNVTGSEPAMRAAEPSFPTPRRLRLGWRSALAAAVGRVAFWRRWKRRPSIDEEHPTAGQAAKFQRILDAVEPKTAGSEAEKWDWRKSIGTRSRAADRERRWDGASDS
jgi:hypothetical protein